MPSWSMSVEALFGGLVGREAAQLGKMPTHATAPFTVDEETTKHGLATVAGTVNHTGVGG